MNDANECVYLVGWPKRIHVYNHALPWIRKLRQ